MCQALEAVLAYTMPTDEPYGKAKQQFYWR
jgi:hypothetical protein